MIVEDLVLMWSDLNREAAISIGQLGSWRHCAAACGSCIHIIAIESINLYTDP